MNKSFDCVIGKSVPSPEALGKINRYSRRALTADETYVFSLILCDNEIDRDNERFSLGSLETLGKMFLGKSGVFDHSATARNQSARIFSTAVKTFPEKRTASGEIYTALTAEAYMPKTAKNADLIEEIDTGIKKEVSISCCIGAKICSVCGKDALTQPCGHTPGRLYSGKKCHFTLENPTDAYEWSFVAVPAQPAAGVTKSFAKKEEKKMNIREKLENSDGTVELTPEEARELKSFIRELQEMAAWGKGYKTSLENKAVRLSGAAWPEMNTKTFREICEKMDICELETVSAALEKQAQKRLPLKSQLAPAESGESSDSNTDFCI